MDTGVFLKVIFHIDHQNNLVYHVQWRPRAEGKDELLHLVMECLKWLLWFWNHDLWIQANQLLTQELKGCNFHLIRWDHDVLYSGHWWPQHERGEGVVKCHKTMAPKVQVRELTKKQCRSCFFCVLFQKKPNCLEDIQFHFIMLLKPSQVWIQVPGMQAYCNIHLSYAYTIAHSNHWLVLSCFTQDLKPR